MPFFKDLRRRSKASFHTTKSNGSKSNDDKSNDSQCNGEASGKSSSTLDTSSYKSATPPPSIRPNRSSPNLPSLTEFNGHSEGSSTPLTVPPQRPVLAHQLQRNSTIVRPADHLTQGISIGNELTTLYREAAHSPSMVVFVLLLRRRPTPRESFPFPIIHGYVRIFPQVLSFLNWLGRQYLHRVH